MDVTDENWVAKIAISLSTSEKSIRLLLSLFAGYPLAFFYRSLVLGRSKLLQHLFFIATGLYLCYFNFGADSIHSIVNTLCVWVLIKVLGGTSLSVTIAFVLNTIYLMCGYRHVSGDDYDISWATPHCVLTLRLTGVVFDLYDGTKKKEKLSQEQRETALDAAPSLLEMMSHTFFFGGFLVGPQFSMKRYQQFVDGGYNEPHNPGPPRNVPQAMSRLAGGVVYIALFQIFISFIFTDDYMLTQSFQDLSFMSKVIYILIWGKFTLGKYAGVWLLVEGNCMLTGLTYNGKDMNGNTLWNGCTNIKVYQMETFTSLREMIASFNVNTNNWMSKYVFKRCKFLGNRHLSQGLTLTYLAVWHGLHTGYYMNFFLEFVMVNAEIQISHVFSYIPLYHRLEKNSAFAACSWTVRKLVSQFALSYALVSFVHLKWNRYMQVYSSVHYVGHVMSFLLAAICVVLIPLLKQKARPQGNGHQPNIESTGEMKKQQ